MMMALLRRRWRRNNFYSPILCRGFLLKFKNMAWFLKYPHLFEDDYKVEDLFNLSNYNKRVWSKIQAMENKWIFWFIWPYGCWKSTIIHNIKSLHSSESDPIWIHFDAWKYHDKKDLWEGFIIDIGIQIWWVSRDDIIREIDGENISFADWLLTSLSVIPWLWWLDWLKKIFESRWISRVFEFQELLRKFLLSTDKEIIITIEDIDRAWEQGLIFLETLNFFLKQELEEKAIKVVVLIGDKSYKNQGSDSYLKSLDITEFFSPWILDFENFINQHFNLWIFPIPSMQSIVLQQLTSLCLELVKSNLTTQTFSLRQIKHIFRAANNNYMVQENKGLPVDYRITIIMEFSKYLISGNWQLEFDRIKSEIVWDGLVFRFIKMVNYDIDSFVKFNSYLISWRAQQFQANIWWIETELFNPNQWKVYSYDWWDDIQRLPRFYIDF